ncbi:beta-carotene isomerase D27, chloroplastic isoform X2 [Magnolia sinica]|uniref:beta-carotene isomerase D27, chloroplastic isoform X2 n=1 Tax=Magnolia sinica TaxID=86752 RepID=UPI002657AC5A|nr:beta-carotene isomerase D27, chloroplastic isoform X2 [Magnolia sinica]
MESLAPLRALTFSFPSQNALQAKTIQKNARISTYCSPFRSQSIDSTSAAAKSEYKPGIFDDFILAWFRSKMVEEVGWDSEKPGYDGLMEVVNRLMIKGKTNRETEQAAVRVLRSLFPPLLLELFQILIAPIGRGKVAAMMVARVTALSCQWLMGPCTVNSVELPGGSACSSGVFIERCKYLEESKCVGICINTCKQPTQFNFGVHPPPLAEDKALSEPCLEICPNATRRRELGRNDEVMQCPKV